MKANKIYAGIGSRKTPEPMLDAMIQIGEQLAQQGWTLRSGGAQGADTAFETGCDRGQGWKEIYLPWKGFNHSKSPLYEIDQEAYEIARKFHPNWAAMGNAGHRLMARNVYQIGGLDLNTPADMVICWTPGGNGSGGTGQAIRLANYADIPVIDMGRLSIQEVTERVNAIVDG